MLLSIPASTAADAIVVVIAVVPEPVTSPESVMVSFPVIYLPSKSTVKSERPDLPTVNIPLPVFHAKLST